MANIEQRITPGMQKLIQAEEDVRTRKQTEWRAPSPEELREVKQQIGRVYLGQR